MISLGYVTVAAAGTPVRLTANQSDPTARVAAQTLILTAKPDNTGVMYVGFAGMNKTTGVGVLGFIGTPAAESSPSFTLPMPQTPASLNAADLYVDADDSGDICAVCVLTG